MVCSLKHYTHSRAKLAGEVSRTARAQRHVCRPSLARVEGPTTHQVSHQEKRHRGLQTWWRSLLPRELCRIQQSMLGDKVNVECFRRTSLLDRVQNFVKVPGRRHVGNICIHWTSLPESSWADRVYNAHAACARLTALQREGPGVEWTTAAICRVKI